MKNNRLVRMEKYIVEKKICSMEELASQFKVSMMTIRNDVKYLVSKGVVKKVYGGVEAVESDKITAYNMRSVEQVELKEKIAKQAAQLIKDEDVIFIDSGTTTERILRYIPDEIKVTIVTHNLPIIVEASRRKNIKLIVLPGEYDPKTNSFIDAESPNALEKYNIDLSIMATTCITYDGKLGNGSSIESSIKSKAIHCARRVVLVADSSKLLKKALMTFGDMSEIDVLIMDINKKLQKDKWPGEKAETLILI